MSTALKQRRWYPAFLAALLLTAPALAQESPSAETEWPKTMYACRHYGQLEGFGGILQFNTLFAEDGSVFSEDANWSVDTRPFNDPRLPPPPSIIELDAYGVRPKGFVTIEWPSDNSWDKSTPGAADARAIVRFSSIGRLFRESLRKKERWHQTVIARNSEVLVHGEGDDRVLILSPLEPALVGDYGNTSNMDLQMPVANLLAWGSGLQTLTVYEVFVEPRPYRRNSYPNGPAGRMRIVGEYRINMSVFSTAFDAMRAQHRTWRDGLGDVKATCEATEVDDPSQEIVVT